MRRADFREFFSQLNNNPTPREPGADRVFPLHPSKNSLSIEAGVYRTAVCYVVCANQSKLKARIILSMH